MTISRKISLSFLISAVALTAACVAIVYHLDREQIERDLLSHLSTTAQSRANSVNIYLAEHVSQAELGAINGSIRELLAARAAGRGESYERALAEAKRSIEAILEKDTHFAGLSIIDREGTVVASSFDEMVGVSMGHRESFRSAIEETHVTDMHTSAASGKAVLGISVPVRAEGRFLGVFLQELSADDLHGIMLDRTGLGKTGEAYLVNGEGYMISPSRFVQDAVLRQKVESKNLLRCRLHRDGSNLPECTDSGVFTDYRGAEVFGTHHYIPSMDWCLLAELDAGEALAPLRRLKLIAACFLVAVPLVALLIGTHVSWIIAGPMEKLREGARVIGKGDLSYRVGATSRDEIGELGRAFDEMAEGLGKATTTIDRLNAEIEERKRVQKELVRLERIKALEEMAAGVSHNLNNILVGVLGHAQLLESSTDDPKVINEVRAIVRSARRAEDVVDRLTLAVRGQEVDHGPVDVAELTQEVVSGALLRLRSDATEGGHRIRIHIDSGYVPLVRASRSGVVQILNNLIQNSIEAMPDGGDIRISLEDSGDFVTATVSDTGRGMDSSVQSKVVEPFFTTKAEVGKGLGLSAVYGLVTRWGGRISIDSEPGQGSAVTVTLPAWRRSRAVGPDGAEGLRAEKRASRSGKILIVDDEEIVTRTLLDCLGELHDVEVARNGREAIELSKTGGFGVALIDLGLPGMPGDMLALRLKEEHPRLVTVLMTGWNMGEGNVRVAGFDLCIRKPFDSLDHVREVMARALDLHEERSGDLSVA